MSDEFDGTKLFLLGKAVRATEAKYNMYGPTGAAVELDPDQIGVCPWNRRGVKPNIHIVHCVVFPSFKNHTFDPGRLHNGYVIWVKCPKMRKEWVEYNKELAAGSSLYPPVYEDKMEYFTLACTHVTITLRCCKAGMISEITGIQFTAGDDVELKKVVRGGGHKYKVLTGDTPKEEAMQLSEWKNADNDTAQGKHELEQILHCNGVAKQCFSEKAQVASSTTPSSKIAKRLHVLCEAFVIGIMVNASHMHFLC